MVPKVLLRVLVATVNAKELGSLLLQSRLPSYGVFTPMSQVCRAAKECAHYRVLIFVTASNITSTIYMNVYIYMYFYLHTLTSYAKDEGPSALQVCEWGSPMA